jgi:hypothetical protein
MSDRDEELEQRGARIGRATDGIVAPKGFVEAVMASLPPVATLDVVRRAAPAALLAALLAAAASFALATSFDDQLDEGDISLMETAD